MAALASVELTADCEHCGLEGGVVEVYDALVGACRFGLPATTRCKLCSVATEGVLDRPAAKPLRDIPANRCPACLHELTPAAVDDRCCSSCGIRAELAETAETCVFATITALESALDRWAERERFPSRQALVAATFADPDVARLFDCLQRKAPLEILADPFANMGVRTTGGSARQKSETNKAASRPRAPAPGPATVRGIGPLVTGVLPKHEARAVQVNPPDARAPNPLGRTLPDPALAATDPLAAPMRPTAPPPSAPPRAIVYPLVSVIAADGEIHPEERALIDRFLQSEGLPPLAEDEFCVHHPSEVAHYVPKERREDVVKLMCESAAVDGMPDESERRVIRAYATAWGVDDEKLEFWMWGYETMNTSLARQLFMKLRRFVLSARWSDAETKQP